MGYEVFESLCKKAGISLNAAATAAGIHSSTIYAWKAGTYVPKEEKRQKLADYFGVSLHYLDTGEVEDTVQIGSEDQSYLQILKDDPKYKVLLHISTELSEDDFEAVKDYAERLRRSYRD